MKTKRISLYIPLLVAMLIVLGLGVSGILWWSSSMSPASQAVRLLTRARRDCASQVGRAEFIGCIKSMVQAHADRIPASSFMEALDTLGSFDYQGINRCHDVAHAVGQVGIREGADISFCSASLCGDGCYHGAMEGLVSTGQQLASVLPALCNTVPSGRSRWACFHGIGHGVGAHTADIEKSFVLCDAFSAPDDRLNCAAGALMELYQSPSVGHARAPLPIGGALDLCRSFPDYYRPVCFVQAGVFTVEATGQPEQAFDVCSAVPLEQRGGCTAKLGAYWLNQYGGDSRKLLSACEQGDRQQIAACVNGAVEESVFSDTQAATARALCSEVEEKEACFRLMGAKAIEAYGQEGRVRLCGFVRADFRPWCLEN